MFRNIENPALVVLEANNLVELCLSFKKHSQPEQIINEENVILRGDLWSLTITRAAGSSVHGLCGCVWLRLKLLIPTKFYCLIVDSYMRKNLHANLIYLNVFNLQRYRLNLCTYL